VAVLFGSLIEPCLPRLFKSLLYAHKRLGGCMVYHTGKLLRLKNNRFIGLFFIWISVSAGG